VLPIAGVGHEIGDRAHRRAACPRYRQPLLLDAEMQAGSVADVLKMLKVPVDLQVER
jgi:hypothetical protein